ncbi:MAG: CpaF family protein [Eggerthellaceae bacterium]
MNGILDKTLSARIKTRVQEELSAQVADQGKAPDEAMLKAMITSIIASLTDSLGSFSPRDVEEFTGEVVNDFLYLGPLQALLADDTVTEIAVNGPHRVYVERAGRMQRAPDIRFDDETHLRRIIDRIGQRVNRRCDDASPLMDARLFDGSRVNAVIPPLAIRGSALTIRKFAKNRMNAIDLLEAESISPAMLAFLAAAVAGRCSIIVAGGTGSGKTTLLNVLSAFIPEGERIVTIEDSAELQLKQDDLVSLESRPANVEGKGEVSIHDLVKNALRMRPDRIIVGECRDTETIEMINAMTTGHDGSLTTIHANDVVTAFSRLETMLLKSASGYDSAAVKRKIAQAVDLVVVVERLVDGTRKITSITAVTGMEGSTISAEKLFSFDRDKGFAPDGKVLGTFVGLRAQPASIRNRIESWGVEYNPNWFLNRYETGCGGA